MKRFIPTSILFLCIVCSLVFGLHTAQATAPIHNSTLVVHSSTPTVRLSIVLGRIYFKPNILSCSHLAKTCFILKYVSNDGPRPVWLNGTQEYILQTGQSFPFTFQKPGTELFTLFQHSIWWKVKVIVN